MRVRLEEEVTKCGVVIGLAFACNNVKYKNFKEIAEISPTLDFGSFLAFVLYKAGEGDIPKTVAVRVVRSLLDFKDRTSVSSPLVVAEIFSIANMVYKLTLKNKYLCKKPVDTISLFSFELCK